jgi:hypothetical protein
MKNLIILTALMSILLALSPAVVKAWDKNCNRAWKSGSSEDPNQQNPKWLVEHGDPCGDTERDKMNDIEEGWATGHTLWYEDGGNYNWIMCDFYTTSTNWETALARFKAKVESGNAVTLWAWSSGSWHDVRTNDGGSNPAVEEDIDVSDYINIEYTDPTTYRVILLMETANGSPYNEMWCDVCDMNVSN